VISARDATPSAAPATTLAAKYSRSFHSHLETAVSTSAASARKKTSRSSRSRAVKTSAAVRNRPCPLRGMSPAMRTSANADAPPSNTARATRPAGLRKPASNRKNGGNAAAWYHHGTSVGCTAVPTSSCCGRAPNHTAASAVSTSANTRATVRVTFRTPGR
jgi:hypothetical protein